MKTWFRWWPRSPWNKVLAVVVLLAGIGVLFGQSARHGQRHQLVLPSFSAAPAGVASPAASKTEDNPAAGGEQSGVGEEALTPDPSWQADDVLARFIRASQKGVVRESLPRTAYAKWPDMARLADLYAADRRGEELKFDSEAEKLVYGYLFADSDSCAQTLEMMGRALCLARMDEVWPQVRHHAEVPSWGRCPSSGLKYRLQPGKVNKLVCPKHALKVSFPRRTVENVPPELYSQLLMGYFNAKRLHRLDEALLGSAPSAARPGESVCDVGCGVGCYTWAMARAVGEKGHVLALDVDPSTLGFIRYVADRRKVTNVETRQTERHYPKLHPRSLDRIFVIDVYNVIVGVEMDVEGRISEGNRHYVSGLVEALKPGGKLVVIDFPPENERPHVACDTAAAQLEDFGLQLVHKGTVAAGPGQMYVLVLRKSQDN